MTDTNVNKYIILTFIITFISNKIYRLKLKMIN